MKTRVSSRGQLVLPSEIRREDGIEAGDVFEIERLEPGEYRLVRRERAGNSGLIDWLLSCPEKGWFVPVEGESTDAL